MMVPSTRTACAHACGKLTRQHCFSGHNIAHHLLHQTFGSEIVDIYLGRLRYRSVCVCDSPLPLSLSLSPSILIPISPSPSLSLSLYFLQETQVLRVLSVETASKWRLTPQLIK